MKGVAAATSIGTIAAQALASRQHHGLL